MVVQKLTPKYTFFWPYAQVISPKIEDLHKGEPAALAFQHSSTGFRVFVFNQSLGSPEVCVEGLPQGRFHFSSMVRVLGVCLLEAVNAVLKVHQKSAPATVASLQMLKRTPDILRQQQQSSPASFTFSSTEALPLSLFKARASFS